MQKTLLTLNTGSSNLKFAYFGIEETDNVLERLVYGQIDYLDNKYSVYIKNNIDNRPLLQKEFNIGSTSNKLAYAVKIILDWLKENFPKDTLCVAGHRIVHGGHFFTTPTNINSAVIKKLESLSPLAPLHQPPSIAAIHALSKQFPILYQVACFDTTFHATQLPEAQAVALPTHIASIPIKRYGFHGLSYEYIAQTLPNYLNDKVVNGKIIVAHLGYGASLCALAHRKSIATTMGFTPLDGLPMATRCGSLDPGIILYLLSEQKMSVQAISDILYEHSGLLGMSGISADIRVLLKDTRTPAKAAIQFFIYRIQREIGSLVAALGGLDSLIFTGGIGEHQAVIRQKICQPLDWLGINMDVEANKQQHSKISAKDSRVSVWVIPTNEEKIIAQYALELWRISHFKGKVKP